MKKSLIELRTTGFAKLKKGKIHLRCSYCGRKMSNMDREEDFDPLNAFLAEILCEKCCIGAIEPETYYYDNKGNEIITKDY
jgi:hypothetical protein